MLKLKYSKNTVGCRSGNEIFVHPKLYKNPRLYKAVLAHEIKHSKGFAVKDIVLDLFNDDLKGHKKDYYKFMLKNPRTFLGLLPITKIGNYWAIDLTMGIFYLTFIAIALFIARLII